MTCKSQVLPTTVQTGAPAAIIACMPGSSAAATPRRRVMPNAHTCACFSGRSRDALEVLGVLRVRAREAPLDEVEAEIIEHLRDEQLVLHGEVDPFSLGAVAQGGVVELDGHCRDMWLDCLVDLVVGDWLS